MKKSILFKILTSDDVVKSINENLEQLLILIPEIKDMIGFEHNNPHHHLDVWNHTLLALSISENNFEIRLALLLHDIGKPHSYQDLEIRHFKGHPKVSSQISRHILTRLNFEKQEIDEMCYLIENHDYMITKGEIKKNKLLATKQFKIQFCDGLAHNPTMLEKRRKYLLVINERINDGKEKEKYQLLITNLFNDKIDKNIKSKRIKRIK